MTSAKVTGPLFTLGAVVTDTFTQEACESLAKEGAQYWISALDDQMQNPTGYYTSNISSERTGVYNARLNDNGIVYGPWLEGIGSRNATTTFKGYHALRDTLHWMENEGADHSQQLFVSRYWGKLR